eukprot:CAMPEP_0202352026 /NCGR_PEP_ID=MMETSP1126-20121109/8399_1 /ASSEMBLY_ACC=CAM_ASM_000457 /TAXON_ID=3047 /ORGANISM="Dunaliella tertiolecta, Strain CCMP1320" /LENGTH=54 /DNA_ID=CAMNT_0048944187 /DNA_START=1127 /DNA_END=1291 /DNA_ORIENTATION=-
MAARLAGSTRNVWMKVREFGGVDERLWQGDDDDMELREVRWVRMNVSNGEELIP